MGIFTNNYWVGWVGQSNFASYSIAIFFGRCRKLFRQRWLSSQPPWKNWPVRLCHRKPHGVECSGRLWSDQKN